MRSVKQVMEYCSEASSILIYSILLHQAWKIVKFTSDKSVIRVVRRLHNEKLDSINLQFKIFFAAKKNCQFRLCQRMENASSQKSRDCSKVRNFNLSLYKFPKCFF